MADYTSLIVFVVFGLFASHCHGQCGFPGRPMNGSAALHLEPRSLNEMHSENSSLSATYSCDENHLLEPSSSRQCVGGRWDKDIPQCVEIKPISELYGSNASLIDLSRCQEIKSGYSYKFEIEKERRLHSIPVRAATFDWNSFKNAALTIEGRKNDQSKWELLNVTRTNLVPDSNSSFVLTGYSKNYFKLFKNFRLTSNNWSFYICKITLFAYHDECGHPEAPLHGHVQFEPGDTKATYRCDDGYQLNVPYDIRHCVRGKWNGSQPICVNQGSRPTTPRTTTIAESYTQSSTLRGSVSNSNSTTGDGTIILFVGKSDLETRVDNEAIRNNETYILVGVCSCLFTIVAMLLIILYWKNRKKGDVHDSSKPEDDQRTVDSVHRKASRFNPVDYAEDEDAESARDEYRKRYKREEMECDSPIYAEVYSSDDTDGSSSVRLDRREQFIYANEHDISQGVPIGSAFVWPDRRPQSIYANIHDVSQGVPIYAKIDKSKKTRRK